LISEVKTQRYHAIKLKDVAVARSNQESTATATAAAAAKS